MLYLLMLILASTVLFSYFNSSSANQSAQSYDLQAVCALEHEFFTFTSGNPRTKGK